MNNLLPNKIPVVPLRNTVPYPNLTQNINIGRVRSINALLEALKTEDKYLIIVTEKPSKKNQASKTHETAPDPKPEELYQVGTLVRIEKSELSNSQEVKRGYTIKINTLERFRIDKFEVQQLSAGTDSPWDDKHLLVAMGETVPDRSEISAAELEELINQLKSKAEELLRLRNEQPMITILQGLKTPSDIVNLCALRFNSSLNGLQELLEEVVIEVRAKKLLEMVTSKLEEAEVGRDVFQKTSDSLSKTQREIFLRQQLQVIKDELGENSSPMQDEFLKKVRETKMPVEVKKVAEEEVRRLENLHPSSSEYQVVRNYLDWIISIPWNKSSKDNIDIDHARKVLNEDHYGLEKIKTRILQYLAVAKMRNNLKGPILCLVGPPGVGKTSLGRSIARAVGRNYVRVSLGGVRDEAEIRGHRRTYIGAMPGKLIQSLKRVGTNNPLFVLDEIDKMGQGMQGDPASAMLEVLDPEQNNTFTDHYLDVPVDLSNVFFVATANLIENIPAPLRDRMEIIYISGYTIFEKNHIAMAHLVPKMLKENGLTAKQVLFREEGVTEIIASYTREAGVRELQRKISSICRYAAQDLIEHKKETIEITANYVKKALGSEKIFPEIAATKLEPGTVTGLAWTQAGGDILFIESIAMPGNGRLTLTGQLGEVMRESAQIALSYIKARMQDKEFKRKFDQKFDFDKSDIHIHLPAGAIPKDGPSAGVTLATSLLSMMLKKSIDPKIAMTGELSLRGLVMPVGGIKEKLLAAHRAGITTIFMPKMNELNLEEIPKEVLDKLKIHLVEKVDEIWEGLFTAT